MRIDGGCHCGQVTYEAEVDPEQVSICHCTDCQALTGSAFRVTVLTAARDLRLTGHPPKIYRKIGDNGRGRLQYFCPACGSPLFTNGEDEDREIWGIRWGSIRQRADLVPRRQVWCRSAAPWVERLGGLDRRATEAVDDPPTPTAGP